MSKKWPYNRIEILVILLLVLILFVFMPIILKVNRPNFTSMTASLTLLTIVNPIFICLESLYISLRYGFRLLIMFLTISVYAYTLLFYYNSSAMFYIFLYAGIGFIFLMFGSAINTKIARRKLSKMDFEE